VLQDERRIAENEVRFRAVNEDIDRGRPATGAQARVPFVCECGHADCHRLVDLTPREYQAVRADARHFFVVDGHQLECAEDVVERHEGWLVVRKTGVGADIADAAEGQR
jgi:hypothetical protein